MLKALRTFANGYNFTVMLSWGLTLNFGAPAGIQLITCLRYVSRPGPAVAAGLCATNCDFLALIEDGDETTDIGKRFREDWKTM